MKTTPPNVPLLVVMAVVAFGRWTRDRWNGLATFAERALAVAGLALLLYAIYKAAAPSLALPPPPPLPPLSW
jgi:hypothetical protein